MSEKNFLCFAEQLTGTPKENIKVVWFSADGFGFEGTIEIDGQREYIHNHIC